MTVISVTKVMTTETAHRLCEYSGKCAHIHGHSYRWEVTAALKSRETLVNGITIDFSELKAAMRKYIYDRFDHALVLWEQDPLIEITAIERASDGEPQKIVWTEYNPTAEEFAKDTAWHLQKHFNSLVTIERHLVVDILRVRVWETADSYGQWEAYDLRYLSA